MQTQEEKDRRYRLEYIDVPDGKVDGKLWELLPGGDEKYWGLVSELGTKPQTPKEE